MKKLLVLAALALAMSFTVGGCDQGASGGPAVDATDTTTQPGPDTIPGIDADEPDVVPGVDTEEPDVEPDVAPDVAPPQCVTDEDCAPLEDGDLCNGTLACQAGGCVVDPGTVVTCEESADPCLAALCDPASGLCNMAPSPDGSPCDDGDPCSDPDTCQAGACVGGADICTPECGDDACDEGETCEDCPEDCGQCCTPDCDGKECGDDECGGSCGSCPDNGVCGAEGACYPLLPGSCDGRCDEYQGIAGQCECDVGCFEAFDCCQDICDICAEEFSFICDD